MKLTDLNPEWLGTGGTGITEIATGLPIPRREGTHISFDCPCGCPHTVTVPLANPLGGGPDVSGRGWQRSGETFDTLTLTPSIQRISPCSNWHGFVTNGEIVTC